MREPCACGCGEPASRGSKYVKGHYQYWVIVRRRFRACRRYANRHGIDFTVTEQDFSDVIGDAWRALSGVAIRRIDRSVGFIKGNLCLGKGRRRRPESPDVVLTRLQKFLGRNEVACDLTVAGLETTFHEQRGRCWYTKRPLILNMGVKHPEALAIVKIDRSGGFTQDNIRLVVRALAPMLEWGYPYFMKLAREAVAVADERRAIRDSRSARGASSRSPTS
jgi:hypothetical protein